MNSRRSFFHNLATGLIVVATPGIFVPKLIKPVWKSTVQFYDIERAVFSWKEVRIPMILCWESLQHDAVSVEHNFGVTEIRHLLVTQTATIEDAISSLI